MQSKITITNTLKDIEQSQQVKILYAIETGSRAWGFPSPHSDYDVRIIYRRAPDWYLSLTDKKDTFEMMLADGELDFSGWDIKKCLQLMWKSNGALLEWLQSPIIYQEEQHIGALLKDYAGRCFSPITTLHHYLGMAKNSFAEVDGKQDIKLKKLFYALRATFACKWLLEKEAIPPIVFMEMVDTLDFDDALKTKIVALIELKAGKSEAYIHPAQEDLNQFIHTELQIAEQAFARLPGRKQKEVDLDTLFKNIVMGLV
jgi:uncharacterized protein